MILTRCEHPGCFKQPGCFISEDDVSDESQWRVWLPRIVVAGSPFLLAAISVTAAQFGLHGDLPLSARNSILLANLVVAVAASIAGGLFCRDRL